MLSGAREGERWRGIDTAETISKYPRALPLVAYKYCRAGRSI